jgi:hypothetical protein
MKRILPILLLFSFFTLRAYCQHAKAVDTVKTMDNGTTPPIYAANKVYWEKNLDRNNQLVYEGLKYNSCFIGSFIAYWSSGIVRTKGQYLQNNSGSWSALKERGQCSVKDGVWKEYNEDGELTQTTVFKKGKIVSGN